MSRTIGSYEAKTRFAELIRDASAGEEITITNHGKPVARIVPPEGSPALPVEDVIESIHRLRDSISSNGVTSEDLADAIKAGRA